MKKQSIIAAILGLAAITAQADDWKQWKWDVQPIYSVAVSDFKFTNVKQGGGLAFELFPLENISFQLQGVTYDVHDSTVDEASVQLNYYVPVKNTPFSFVATLGTLKGFEQNENWNYKTGAGIVGKLSDNVSVRAGGYIVDDFQNNTELRFEAAAQLSF